MNAMIKSHKYKLQQLQRQKAHAEKIALLHPFTEAGQISRAQVEILDDMIHYLEFTIEVFTERQEVA